jgi:hypothetical protein
MVPYSPFPAIFVISIDDGSDLRTIQALTPANCYGFYSVAFAKEVRGVRQCILLRRAPRSVCPHIALLVSALSRLVISQQRARARGRRQSQTFVIPSQRSRTCITTFSTLVLGRS